MASKKPEGQRAEMAWADGNERNEPIEVATARKRAIALIAAGRARKGLAVAITEGPSESDTAVRVDDDLAEPSVKTRKR